MLTKIEDTTTCRIEDCRIDWDGASIREVEPKLWKRKALEAVYPNTTPHKQSGRWYDLEWCMATMHAFMQKHSIN